MVRKWTYVMAAAVLLAGVGLTRADLVGHWRLDETSGTVAVDDSGNGNDGTLNGNPQWVTGMIGGALELDGDGDYVDCGNDAVFDITDEITLAVWVKANDMGNGEHNCWLGKGDNAYAIKHQTGNYLEFFVYDGSWHSTNYSTDLDSLNGEWHHMAGTLDGTELKFYLDGEEAATLAFAGSIGTATHAVTLGENSQATGRFFDGALDDARIYNTALSPEEIVAVMQAEPVVWALGPKPADGSVHEATSATLQWRPGAFAASHTVYFGESFDDVAEGRIEPVSVALPTLEVGTAGNLYPEGLVPGTTYYWRVDEVNDLHAEGPWPGQVWSFIVRPLTAWNPTPGEGAQYVMLDQGLTWDPGLGNLFHTIYFGDSLEAVEAGTASMWMTTDPVCDPGPLEVGKTYYWRVDEFTGFTTNRGDIWSFSTVPEIVVTDEDLVGWWTLDEGTGTTAVDWSGHGHHGQVLGDAVWTGGVQGGALYLANGAHVDIAAPQVETNTMTMTAWVNRDGPQADWAGVLFCREGSAVSGMGLNPTNELRYHWTDLYYDFATGVFAPANEWFFMALVVEPDRGTLYYNGTETFAENVAEHALDPFDGTLRIGQDWAGRDLQGTVDDVRFYNRVLSTAELAEVMRGDSSLAGSPSPAPDAVVDIRDVGFLSWVAGDTAASHDVYFGQDAGAVATAGTDSELYRGNQAGTSVSLAALVEFGGGDYYWRIDEVQADGTAPAGTVWKFTVPPVLIVEGFEGYNDNIEAGTTIYLTWIDGFDNGTGSQVGYLESAGGTFGEIDVVHGGGQSMPLTYDNANAPFYSETERTWAVSQNWTVEGADALVFYVSGSGSNDASQPLYVALRDSTGNTGVVACDVTILTSSQWTECRIPLADFGVNATVVKAMAIGVGDRNAPTPGGAGLIYIDDIGVAKPSP